MKVIVDTSVWSLALRRQKTSHQNPEIVQQLQDLILQGRVILLGAVRQEILSGIRHQHQYEQLKNNLRAFPNLELQIEDYELAAEFYNTCRKQGIQGANTDFLICASAIRRNYQILTTDKDFENFLPYISIQLFRESVTLNSAEESFRQGWQEAITGNTIPVSELWDGIDAE